MAKWPKEISKRPLKNLPEGITKGPEKTTLRPIGVTKRPTGTNYHQERISQLIVGITKDGKIDKLNLSMPLNSEE